MQTAYDHTDRDFGVAGEVRDTIEFDLQHRFPIGERNEIVWGGGYRFSEDELTTTPDFEFRQPSQGIQLVNLFVQDEIALSPDRFHLTLGTKVEHNDFTGFEIQPSARLSWTPHERHTVWGAISRAVRTPSRSERNVSTFVELFPPIPDGVLTPAIANPGSGSEDLLAFEVGYRATINPRLTLGWASFYNVYDNLRSFVSLPIELRQSPMPHLVASTGAANDLFGETYGSELSVTWQPLDAWRLRASYTLLEMKLHTRGPARSLSEDLEEGGSPHHQFSIGSDVDFGRNVEFGLGIRYVDRVPYWDIDDYTELEARLAWKPTTNCELAIIGSNLLHSRHREFAPLIISIRDVEIERSVFGKITWRF